MPVLKVPIIMRLITRTLAAENAITLFFIPSNFLLIKIYLLYTTARTNASKYAYPKGDSYIASSFFLK